MENKEITRLVITYEILYEFLRKEKTRDEIQELPVSFYEDIIDYLEKKKQELKEHTVSLDLFADNRKRDSQAGNAVKLIREIYDRREKKILFLAMNKARTDSNIIDTANLLPSEKELFDSLVNNLKQFRQNILFSLFSGKSSLQSLSKPYKENEKIKKESQGTKVQFLQKMPKFIGKNASETYGPYEPNDTAELPPDIAQLLIKKGRAQINE